LLVTSRVFGKGHNGLTRVKSATYEVTKAGTRLAQGGRMNNVVSINVGRELKKIENEDLAYQAQILGMDKVQLLEEMVRFQEDRASKGELTLAMMKRGRFLFKALEESAETAELYELTRSYRRHLEHELLAHKQKQSITG